MQWNESQEVDAKGLENRPTASTKSHHSGSWRGCSMGGLEMPSSKEEGHDIQTSDEQSQKPGRTGCHKARANLRRSSPLELMAYGGLAGDPQVTAHLNTIRVWQRKLNTGTWA
eukprot:2524243-Amphidinium_carterae.1